MVAPDDFEKQDLTIAAQVDKEVPKFQNPCSRCTFLFHHAGRDILLHVTGKVNVGYLVNRFGHEHDAFRPLSESDPISQEAAQAAFQLGFRVEF